MTPGGFRLGRIFGVEIQIDWSLTIIFILITADLALAVFPSWHPEWSALTTWATALSAALLFFASVLAHELSHAVVARVQDIPVRRITLFLFGGMAHMEREPPSPKSEFLMAVVGPVASLAIGVGATAGGALLAAPLAAALADDPRALLAALGPGATLLLWLGPVNIVLALFNMVPGFPLDGGRVLRSLLWWLFDDLERATRWAANGGKLVAFSLMGIGVMSLFSGGIAQGLWLLLIGWFLFSAARMSYEQVVVRHALEDISVSRIMRTNLAHASMWQTLEQLVREQIMVTDQRAFLVEGIDGAIVGLVTVEDVRRIPPDDWPYTKVGEVMKVSSELHTLPADAGADRALEELAREDVEQIPVSQAGDLIGLVQRKDILRWLALKTGAGPRDAAPA